MDEQTSTPMIRTLTSRWILTQKIDSHTLHEREENGRIRFCPYQEVLENYEPNWFFYAQSSKEG